MGKIIRLCSFFLKLTAASVLAPFIKLFCPSLRNVWIISERGNDARDNGYFFYQYMVEKHPEQPIWYVIRSDSPDFERIAPIGKWVEFESFRHYLFYALAKVRISSSLWGGDLPKMSYFKQLRKFIGRRKPFIFLKHGIIKDYLPQHCYGEGYPDLYVCGAKPEYDYVKANFGYPEGVVQYLGLARFDNLHDAKTKRQILFMPTFRKWLPKMTKEQITESEYVRCWNAAIRDPALIALLEENDIELVFYPHHVMQKYLDAFHSSSERVKIAAFKDYDVQTLLMESALLVTDFSSVFFDFGYMGKPVVYYQFDRERYVNEHYDFTKGYFSYDDHGFGEVAFDGQGLFAAIERVVKNGFVTAPEYQTREKTFFPLNDRQNCERIYRRILVCVNEGKRK